MMVGVLAATTLGAGIFTLPWIFHAAGWRLAGGLLIALAALVVFAEYCYWRTLDAVGGKERLIGLARDRLGKAWSMAAFIGVMGGMFFALVIYLALAERFLGILLPLHGTIDLLIFWALAVIPATFGIRRFAAVENTAVACKCLLIIFIFFSASHPGAILQAAAPTVANPLFAFGALIFALSGWNAIEPMYELWRSGEGKKKNIRPLAVLIGGMAAIAVLYILFPAAILGSLSGGSFLATDTLSGLVGWPAWKIGLLALLGLFAVWTSYLPASLEIENALHKDLHWHRRAAFLVVALAPLLAVLAGFRNVIEVMAFSGAIFVGMQYLVIFALAERVLRPRRAVAWAMRAGAGIFVLAAVYEVVSFVVR
jgi:hypothetical protein